MTNIIYSSVISSIGEFASEALSEGMLITFKEGAPSDLADYCFIHSHDELIADLSVGYTIQLGQSNYIISAVGGVASVNFRELGHITIRFDGEKQAELAGTIHVIGTAPKHLNIGDSITILVN